MLWKLSIFFLSREPQTVFMSVPSLLWVSSLSLFWLKNNPNKRNTRMTLSIRCSLLRRICSALCLLRGLFLAAAYYLALQTWVTIGGQHEDSYALCVSWYKAFIHKLARPFVWCLFPLGDNSSSSECKPSSWPYYHHNSLFEVQLLCVHELGS